MIIVETTIEAGIVTLAWCCKNCKRDWPISNEQRITLSSTAE